MVHTFPSSISRSHTAGTVSTLSNIYPGNPLVNLGKRVWCNLHQIEILKTILPVDNLSVPHPFSIWFNGLSPSSQAYVNIVDLHGQTVIFPFFCCTVTENTGLRLTPFRCSQKRSQGTDCAITWLDLVAHGFRWSCPPTLVKLSRIYTQENIPYIYIYAYSICTVKAIAVQKCT